MSRALDESLPSLAGTSAATSATDRRAPAWRRALRRAGRLVGLDQSTSLARRFLLASLLVLVLGGLTVGWWIGGQLERGIIDRTASITGLYVESFVQPHLESLADGEWLTRADTAQLDALLASTPLGERIVALKVWRPDGMVVYSPDRSLIGQAFPIDDKLRQAIGGTVVADMSGLEDVENVNERARGFDRLLEMYVPVRERGGERVVAVAEFYQLPTEIDQEVRDAQIRSWLVVAAAVALAYVLLYRIVRQGSDTIDRQQLALQAQVSELSALLEQNEQLRDRVRVAAERNTTLSERQLRRISSDLHDGPGQMLGLALLRLDAIEAEAGSAEAGGTVGEVKAALNDALRDMRSIAAGLRLPELSSLSTEDTIRRAVDDHVRRTRLEVTLAVPPLSREASLPTKIALFRAIQELLSNATRHGQGRDVRVVVEATSDTLRLTVSDGGPGIDPGRIETEGHLGLVGLREQAELLGGGFEIGLASDEQGARVSVWWPL